MHSTGGAKEPGFTWEISAHASGNSGAAKYKLPPSPGKQLACAQGRKSCYLGALGNPATWEPSTPCRGKQPGLCTQQARLSLGALLNFQLA